MNLSEHMDILGHDASDLAFRAKVDKAVVERAMKGLPITKLDAKKIASYIGQRFDHPHNAQEDYQIDGLKAV